MNTSIFQTYPWVKYGEPCQNKLEPCLLHVAVGNLVVGNRLAFPASVCTRQSAAAFPLFFHIPRASPHLSTGGELVFSERATRVCESDGGKVVCWTGHEDVAKIQGSIPCRFVRICLTYRHILTFASPKTNESFPSRTVLGPLGPLGFVWSNSEDRPCPLDVQPNRPDAINGQRQVLRSRVPLNVLPRRHRSHVSCRKNMEVYMSYSCNLATFLLNKWRSGLLGPGNYANYFIIGRWASHCQSHGFEQHISFLLGEKD